jgi:hypothetical protein
MIKSFSLAWTGSDVSAELLPPVSEQLSFPQSLIVAFTQFKPII